MYLLVFTDLHRALCAKGLRCGPPGPSLPRGAPPQGHRPFQHRHHLQCTSTEKRDNSHDSSLQSQGLLSTKCFRTRPVQAQSEHYSASGGGHALTPQPGARPGHTAVRGKAQAKHFSLRLSFLCSDLCLLHVPPLLLLHETLT